MAEKAEQSSPRITVPSAKKNPKETKQNNSNKNNPIQNKLSNPIQKSQVHTTLFPASRLAETQLSRLLKGKMQCKNLVIFPISIIDCFQIRECTTKSLGK